jgi:cobalt-zinc-cadmium efflux system membrane fusion protein
MSRKLLGLAFGMLGLVCAHAEEMLRVTPEELTRLGVELDRGEPVSSVDVLSTSATVVVPPARETIVSAPTSGLITRLWVAEGDPVAAGQALAELRSPEYLSLQREYLDALGAGELAAAQLARDQALFAEGIIAARRLEETTAAERAAALRRAQAEQQLALAGMSQADRASLAARRELAAVLIVRAPFDGVVTAELATVGAQVDALAPVQRIADLSHLWLQMYVAPERVAGITIGMQAAVSSGGSELVGAVTRVSQVVNPATQTVLVRAEIENPDLKLRAGQVLAAHIRELRSGSDPVIALPMAAVARSGSGSYVFVRTEQGVAVRAVAPLSADGVRVYVAGDIDATTELAVSGISALKSLWLSTQEEGS